MREPPTLLLLTGPPGTGKSTLAERAANFLADVLARWEPPAGCDLHLDAVASLESNTVRLRDLLRR